MPGPARPAGLSPNCGAEGTRTPDPLRENTFQETHRREVHLKRAPIHSRRNVLPGEQGANVHPDERHTGAAFVQARHPGSPSFGACNGTRRSSALTSPYDRRGWRSRRRSLTSRASGLRRCARGLLPGVRGHLVRMAEPQLEIT